MPSPLPFRTQSMPGQWHRCDPCSIWESAQLYSPRKHRNSNKPTAKVRTRTLCRCSSPHCPEDRLRIAAARTISPLFQVHEPICNTIREHIQCPNSTISTYHRECLSIPHCLQTHARRFWPTEKHQPQVRFPQTQDNPESTSIPLRFHTNDGETHRTAPN